MRTEIAASRLEADPKLSTSEKILRSCVHCGFCNATCPTHLLLGDELDGPRGRIYLIKDMLEQDKPASHELVTHVDRCLSCLSCVTTCPSGVDYMHLVDHARARIEETYQRPWHDRLIRSMLARILPYPRRFRAALVAARFGRPFRRVLSAFPAVGPRLAAMLDLAPRKSTPPLGQRRGQVFPAIGGRSKRVALLVNCTQPVLNPDINEAAVRLLTRNGVEVVLTAGEGCCGALVHHMGREAASKRFAAANIDAWAREIEGEGLDAIVITASGCGTTIKDYGFMFRHDADYAAKAARVSALALDITEFVESLGLPAAGVSSGLRVAYHSACSMQHGQRIKEGPKRLLSDAGFDVTEVPEGHICCGSAGVYNILQPEIATRLRDRKVENIALAEPDLVASGNIGCMVQIARGMTTAGGGVPVVHTVELLDWATGGPTPAALARSDVSPTAAPMRPQPLLQPIGR